MRKAFVVPLILFGCLMLAGCERDRGVSANNDAYQPRPAPVPKPVRHDVQGELVRVDMRKGLFVVRLENGMEQTFKFDDDTSVFGLAQQGHIKDLVGKEGSEVMVLWQEDDALKMANRVDVTQVITSKAKRRNQR